MTVQTTTRLANALIHSTSPYLLQHAYNPVNWYPWCEEALQKSRDEDKPIFLSIGYSACHWCHVMERECFENKEIADFLNDNFISIKVDREERPDLDEIYMNVVQAMTGQGGWPMSVFLTSDQKPIFSGTYFPPQDRYGHPGFASLLISIANAYREHRSEIQIGADRISDHIQGRMRVRGGDSEIAYSWIEHSCQEMSRRFDAKHGGFGDAPKFPHSMDLSLLLRHAHKTGNSMSLEMAELTLQKMARGGMYDQLGGGFHRYSTDARWLIPHFEKMLYDNALLAKTYTEAYQLTRNPFYKRIVGETLDYILREMASPEGAFYSSQDADSEGREGAFFCWTPKQIAAVVGDEKSRLVCRVFGVEEEATFEEGASVLHRPLDDITASRLFALSKAALSTEIESVKVRLFQIREERIKPGRDEKILADWNGLTISAMAFAGAVFDKSRYSQAAESCCEYLLETHWRDGELLRASRDGRAHIPGFLSDYAFFVQGLLDTYESSGNPKWLETAIVLMKTTIDKFWDNEEGAFFFTATDCITPIVRSRNPLDNAVPSGNSIAFLNLLRLSHITGNEEYRNKAICGLRFYSNNMERFPSAYPQMLAAVDFLLALPKEIVLAGRDAESLKSMKQALFTEFMPHKVVLYRYPHEAEILDKIAPIVRGKEALQGESTAYVCRDFTCKKPVGSIQELLEAIRE